MPALSAPQQKLLADITKFSADHPDYAENGLLISGKAYRSALALERRGLARVRYQGPSMGWLTLPPKPLPAVVSNPEFAEKPHLETGPTHKLACWCTEFDRDHTFAEWKEAVDSK